MNVISLAYYDTRPDDENGMERFIFLRDGCYVNEVIKVPIQKKKNSKRFFYPCFQQFAQLQL